MNCLCGTELIWGGDHSEDESEWAMESNYSCPDCKRFVMVYVPAEEPSPGV